MQTIGTRCNFKDEEHVVEEPKTLSKEASERKETASEDQWEADEQLRGAIDGGGKKYGEAG